MTGAINLAELPAPAFLLDTDFETLMQEQLDELALIDPAYAASIKVGDPGYNVMLAVAIVRQRDRQMFNESGLSVMLAYATGADLDNLVALFNLQRQVIDPGDPEAVPPVDPVYESDESLREKALLAAEGFSSAGSIGAYKFHALTAGREVTETIVETVSPTEVIIRKRIEASQIGETVKDASVNSPSAGVVDVGVLSYSGNGEPSAALVTAVEDALSAASKRPLTDQVNVVAATVTEYAVDATLFFLPGVDRSLVIARAEAAIQKYVNDSHRLGRTITMDGIKAGCYQTGVVDVTLNTPVADIEPGVHEAGYCTGITVADGGLA